MYFMGASAFSHIIIAEDHHPIESSTHTHENSNSHTDNNTLPCSSLDCHIDCASIEESKTTIPLSLLDISYPEMVDNIYNNWDMSKHL